MMFNLDRLETLSNRFDEIEAELANPGETFDQVRFTALVKERAAIEETVRAYRDYRGVLQQIEANDELLGDRSDPELHELAEEEAQTLRESAQDARGRADRTDAAARSERRQRRLRRDSRRRRRRRSQPLRGGTRAHVRALRRNDEDEGRSALAERERGRRLQGDRAAASARASRIASSNTKAACTACNASR